MVVSAHACQICVGPIATFTQNTLVYILVKFHGYITTRSTVIVCHAIVLCGNVSFA